MKKILSILLICAFTLVMVTGCGGAKTSAKKTLVIGLDDQFPPMGFRDEKNNLVGFDIDLANEVAKRLGMEAVPTPIDWSAKELELNNGKVDVLWNGLTITPARQESMLVSPAYIKNAQAVVVSETTGVKELADLTGKKIAYQDGSSAQIAFEKSSLFGKQSEVITAAENITLFQDLAIGRIDAVVVDRVVADYYIAQNPDANLVVLDEVLEDEEYGFAFKKDNKELADKVINEFSKMVEDGTAAKISEKWFGEDRIVFKK